MIKELLTRDFITHYNRIPSLPFNSTLIWKSTENTEFSLIDDDTIIYSLDDGRGVARYNNLDSVNVTVINYEKFITPLPPRVKNTGSIGKNICDLIVYTNDNAHFLLNELTDTQTNLLYEHERYGEKVEGKISKARRQLKQSLENIVDVPTIKNYIDNFKIKHCCFFNKQENNAPEELIATIAFNSFNTISLTGNYMSNPDIENLGFEYWEFYGNQTYLIHEDFSKIKKLAKDFAKLSTKEVKDLAEILKAK